MRRPAYMLGTALLAFAALQLQEVKSSMINAPQTESSAGSRFSSIQRTPTPTPITSSHNQLLPAEPQRWVF